MYFSKLEPGIRSDFENLEIFGRGWVEVGGGGNKKIIPTPSIIVLTLFNVLQ